MASSANAERHPYLKISFWDDPVNQFWNTGMYSQKSKDYLNESVQRFKDREMRFINLEKKK